MSEEQVVDTGIAVLRSLGEAHAHGLVHRDMKPANIFLHQMAGGDSIVKVLDFGIVKDTDSGMTQAGQALGTPTHMSPEQAMGKKVDGRADLYALGVVLYECLTGTLPFFGDNPLAIVMQHVTEPVPPIALRAPGLVRPALAAVVERSLAKEPDDRWQNAVDMRLALQQATGVPSESGMFRMPSIGPDGRPVFQSQIGQIPVPAPHANSVAPRRGRAAHALHQLRALCRRTPRPKIKNWAKRRVFRLPLRRCPKRNCAQRYRKGHGRRR